jgi:hypothetical protein
VLDLRRPAVVAELGITLSDLTGRRSWAHGFAGRARELGAQAMIVPSAALDGEWNLVAFPPGFAHLHAAGSRAMNPRPPST